TFAANGRCDLVERVTRAGPASCDKPKADADSLYVHPSPSLVASAAHMEKMLTPPPPKLDEDGIRAALAAPTSWARLTALILLVEACQDRLR
ncbi:MAG: hypothetical protein JWM65_728, partial [Sphingomonas bacterium]|nr:hypothetical protein [Sphingomonas bacterium]